MGVLEQFLYTILFIHEIVVHGVNAHFVVILVQIVQGVGVQLDEIGLEDLVAFIEGEGVFDCYVLNVPAPLVILLD